MRATGAVPEGVTAIQLGVPLRPFAPSRIHTSLAQGAGSPRPPPKIVIRLLLVSYVARWPYRPWGGVPVGVSALKLSLRLVEVLPSQRSLRSVLVKVCKPPKIIICALTGSQTAECECREGGPSSVQLCASTDGVEAVTKMKAKRKALGSLSFIAVILGREFKCCNSYGCPLAPVKEKV